MAGPQISHPRPVEVLAFGACTADDTETSRSRPERFVPNPRAASLAADDGLPAPALERDAAARADASGGPAAEGGAVGLAPDRGSARAGSGLQLDATVAAVPGRDDQRPQLPRSHPRNSLEVIHHDHHPIERPGFRINTAKIGETRPRA